MKGMLTEIGMKLNAMKFDLACIHVKRNNNECSHTLEIV